MISIESVSYTHLFCPPKNIQTKVYGGGIKGINITVNFHLEVIFVVVITDVYKRQV